MIRIKMLTCLLVVWVVLPLNQTFAQQKLNLTDFKVTNFASGKSSEVNPSGIILRQYSPMILEGVSLDAVPIAFVCKWLNPLGYVDTDFSVNITYQNGTIEYLKVQIPKGSGAEQRTVLTPKKANGQKIVKIDINHGNTAVEIKIFSIELTGGQSCSDRVQALNNNFSIIIDEMKRANANDAFIKKLENLLNEYKGIK
jgi:hypothetical protein